MPQHGDSDPGLGDAVLTRIYLDAAATTPLCEPAREAMLPWLGPAANASSLHAEGRAARAEIDRAREVVADAFGCLFGEVIFTSSGTEAANLAMVGTALGNEDSARRRVLIGAAEHHCVLHTAPLLRRIGYDVTLVPVTREGLVEVEALAPTLGDDVLLVSVMHVNNELGTINPVSELATCAKRAGALFHTDAVQSFPFQPRQGEWDVDLVSVSGHKLNGPTGVGALMIRSGVKVQPLMVGGGQEREIRAGTESVASIVGFAAAVNHARERRSLLSHRASVRDAFRDVLTANGFVPSMTTAPCSGGHLHGRFPGLDAETVLIRLDRAGISASSGAACSSGSLESSHVLIACGYGATEAAEGLRFTFGLEANLEEAMEAAHRVVRATHEIVSARGVS